MSKKLVNFLPNYPLRSKHQGVAPAITEMALIATDLGRSNYGVNWTNSSSGLCDERGAACHIDREGS